MSASTAPVARFTALLERLGGAPDPVLGQTLAAAWAEPHRLYHTTEHLLDCLRELDAAPPLGADREAAEAALWFHDAVYDPRAGDNEERSAAWAETSLCGAGVPIARAAEVGRLVRLTRHAGPAPDPTGALVCDVDLAILGRPGDEYDRYERRIREEYAWVPELLFRRERLRILQGLLARDPLYQTYHFRRRCESAARANLSRSVAALTG